MASIIRDTYINTDAVTLHVPTPLGAGRTVRSMPVDRAAAFGNAEGDDGIRAARSKEDDGGFFTGMANTAPLVPQKESGLDAAEAGGRLQESEANSANEEDKNLPRHAAEIQELQHRLIASEEMLADVRAQIEAEIEEIRSEAWTTGFEQGLTDGRDAAKEQVKLEIQQLRNIVGQLSGLEQQAMELAEDSLVEMSYSAVCKLLGKAIMDGNAIKGVVSQLIERTRGMRVIRIRMRSEDCRKILDLVASGALGADCKGIDFQPDDLIEMGGCVLEGDAGTLDGRLESQLENLKATLLAARASSI